MERSPYKVPAASVRREMAIKRNAGTFLPAEERKKSFEIPARLQIAHQLDDDRRTGGNESTSGGRVPCIGDKLPYYVCGPDEEPRGDGKK